MDKKYERVKDILIEQYQDAGYLMEKFNETDKEIVDEIKAHNQKCKENISNNNHKFWKEILDKSYYADDVLYAIIVSPYAPDDIVEEATQKSTNAQTRLKALERDIEFSDETYDLIYKKTNQEICSVLTQNFRSDAKQKLPFSQHAINYYAKQAFFKPKMKNNKMLIMLAYADDKEFLREIQKSPLINQSRINYLINNENIPEEIRDQIFDGTAGNYDDLIPDYNLINMPTQHMIEEIYLSNIESYFCSYKNDTKDKHIKTMALDRITMMFYNGWMSSSIEKDIISRYVKGDQQYKYLLKRILLNTKNMDTIDFASCLNYSIFAEASRNENLSQEMHEKYGTKHIEKSIKSIQRKGGLGNGNWHMGHVIQKVELKPEHYEILANTNDGIICGWLAASPLTPEHILKKLEHYDSTYDDPYWKFNTSLTATINLLMRKEGFSKDEIITWGDKFLYQLSSVYNIEHIIRYNQMDDAFLNAFKDGTYPKIFAIAIEASKTHNSENENVCLENFFTFASGYEESYRKDMSDDIKEMSYRKLCNKWYDVMYQFKDCTTLGAVYLKLDDYVDDLIKISDEMQAREDVYKTKDKVR